MRHNGATVFALTMLFYIQAFSTNAIHGQNYQRYKPLDLPRVGEQATELPQPEELPKSVEDDRVLVPSLDAVVIVDDRSKIITDQSIDNLEGIHYRFRCTNALVHKHAIRSIVESELGQPITLRAYQRTLS